MKFDDAVEVRIKKSMEEVGASKDNVLENPLLRFFRKLQKEGVNEKSGGVLKRG